MEYFFLEENYMKRTQREYELKFKIHLFSDFCLALYKLKEDL